MSDLRAGDTVELTIEAEVLHRMQSGRVKVRWHSGEETMSPKDARLNHE